MILQKSHPSPFTHQKKVIENVTLKLNIREWQLWDPGTGWFSLVFIEHSTSAPTGCTTLTNNPCYQPPSTNMSSLTLEIAPPPKNHISHTTSYLALNFFASIIPFACLVLHSTQTASTIIYNHRVGGPEMVRCDASGCMVDQVCQRRKRRRRKQ